MGLTELSDALWQERRLLERLIFKLDTVTVLAEAGRWRWLVQLADETRAAADALDQHQEGWYERVLGCAGGRAVIDPTLEASSPRNEILGAHDAALARLRRDVATASSAALASLTLHPANPPTATDEDDDLAVEVFRVALEGLVSVAQAFIGAQKANDRNAQSSPRDTVPSAKSTSGRGA
jgi:hypothetical protein